MTSTVVILGSPRKGNSEAIAEAIANEAKAKGNEIKTFKLNQLKARGCQSCYGCKKAGKCVVKDDMIEVLDAVREADSIILATPDYFSQSTAQYRMFEDRLYGFVGPDFQPTITSKKVAIVVTAGSGAGAENIANSMSGIMANFFKSEVVGQLIYAEAKNGAFADNAEFQAKAAEIANKL